MPRLYEIEIESKDIHGTARVWRFIVIADSRAEMNEEIREVMAHHEEVVSWQLSKLLRTEDLSETSQHTKDYMAKGCHAFYE